MAAVDAWLREHRDAIAARWTALVGALPHARELAQPVLAGDVGALLDAIAARLSGDAQATPPVPEHVDAADVAALLAEYAALRRAVLEVAHADARTFAPAEQIALGLELDRAIAAAMAAHQRGLVREAEARRRAEAALGVLADVGAAIGASLAPASLLQRAAEAVVGPFADACAVHVLAGDTLDRGAVAGQSELLAATDAELRGAIHARTSHVADHALFVPIETGDAVLGVLECRRHARGGTGGDEARGRPAFDADDVRLGSEIAGRIALGLANARLFEAARLEARARDGLVAIVSHDLKNPLGVITMGASTLATRLPEDPRTTRALESIQRAARRMTNLITDLLDTARVQGGQLAIEPKPIAVGTLVDDAIEDARWLAHEKEIELGAELGVARESQVAGDRDRLLQVLGNLLGNAIKFSPRRSRVVVSAERAGAEVIFTVADAGPGISATDAAHVFEPYWSGEKPGSGTGLGLFIARGIVAGHRGRIWVEPGEPTGTRFRFAIPAA